MIRRGMIAIAVGITGLMAATAFGVEVPASAPEGEAALDRQMFVRYCASCHGSDGRGNGPVADAIKKQPSDLTRIAERREGEFPAGEIAQFIDGRAIVVSHGTREMPVWGERFYRELGGDSVAEEISRGRIDLLVDYLRSIQSEATPSRDPGGKTGD